jgi:hypothetical protein
MIKTHSVVLFIYELLSAVIFVCLFDVIKEEETSINKFIIENYCNTSHAVCDR